MSYAPSRRRLAGALVAAFVAAPAIGRAGEATAPVAPPPIVFEGFGLDGFSGAGSVAAALREADAGRPQNEWRDGIPPLDLRVRGPSGKGEASALPLAAEVRSRIDAFDVAAGLQADSLAVQEGRADWTGRIGMKAEHDAGSEGIELRTLIGRRNETGLLGIEVGPRIERRLRRGMVFFIDGKAEARALRSQDTGWWALPGTSTADGMVGVTARTGLVR
ncbi:MAG: hypothetical protein WCC69_14805 [Pirellulales bacterium]